MIELIKKKLKALNHKKGNFLNQAPRILEKPDLNLIVQRDLAGLLEINLFYQNKKLNLYFWSQILNYLNNQKLNENVFFYSIKNDIKNKNILELITVYQILSIIGKFTLALKVRKFFFNKISKMNFYFNSKYLKRLDRINNFSQILNINKLFKNKKRIKNYFIEDQKLSIEDSYSKFIKKKKIALFGIASKKKNINEVKNFDVLVLFNHWNKFQVKKFPKIDTVSYYSDWFFNTKSHLIEKKLDINFILTKNFDRFKKSKKSKKSKKFKNYQVKTFPEVQDVMFGNTTLLINTVLDLIKKNPSKVNVFNSTLYYPLKNQLFGSTKNSGKSLYDRSYKKYEGATYNPVPGFLRHDRISEFLILRSLFHLDLISADENLKYVLNLKTEKFAENMESFYKKFVIIEFQKR